MNNEKDIQYQEGIGAVEVKKDSRDYVYDDLAMGASAIEIDWDKGFDIRNVIGGDIRIKNQKTSLSCVAQAWAYQVWVFRVLEAMKKYNLSLVELQKQYPDEVAEVSAKSIYPFIYLPQGGAYIYKGGRRIVKNGALNEVTVPSNRPDGSTDESFMREKDWFTDEIKAIATLLKG